MITGALKSAFEGVKTKDLRDASRKMLLRMDTYAREQVFDRVYFSKHPQGCELTDEQRWALLETFLERCAFECAEVDG